VERLKGDFMDYGCMASQLKCEAKAMEDSLSQCTVEQLERLQEYLIFRGYRQSVELGNRLGVVSRLLKEKQADRELGGNHAN
jgi:hypothetical protein